MSKIKRGNSVRPNAGPRRSNVHGFAAYPETPRPGPAMEVQPIEEPTTAPPPVVLNGSALPKAAAVVAEIESANDDAAPDSGEVVVAKEVGKEKEAKAKEPAKADPEPAAVKMRTDRPERPERRSRERKGGRGRSAAPPPVAEEPKAAPAATAAPEPAESPEKVAEVASPERHAPAADLDERFFAEGVHSEHEMLAAAVKAQRPSAPIEEEIDPKILLKLQPDVRARRAKNGAIVKWVSITCIALLGVGLVIRYRNGQSGQEAAEREMAAYAAAHTYTEPTDKPPAAAVPTPAGKTAPTAAAAPTAATSADLEAVPPPPADSAVANAAPGDKAPVGPEAKTVASAAPAPGAAPGAAQTDTDTPPAKTAQQEKRDAQVFLDRGAFGNAAAAGERSVALDPSDGEAWLLLGAAYQSQGRGGDARRSFNNCLKLAKRGPIGECRAMLQ